jgi:hypothetical protein
LRFPSKSALAAETGITIEGYEAKIIASGGDPALVNTAYNGTIGVEDFVLAEHHIYRVSRLGIQYYNQNAGGANTPQLNAVRKSTSQGNSTTPFYNPAGSLDGSGRLSMGTDTTIEYDPNGNPQIANADGTYGRPPFIGLDHELGHAEYYGGGAVDYTYEKSVVDPDTGNKGGLTKEEIRNRVLDSKIRKEQKVVERAKPYR